MRSSFLSKLGHLEVGVVALPLVHAFVYAGVKKKHVE